MIAYLLTYVPYLGVFVLVFSPLSIPVAVTVVHAVRARRKRRRANAFQLRIPRPRSLAVQHD
jgi:hypothetical protein